MSAEHEHPVPPTIVVHSGTDPTIIANRSPFAIRNGSYEAWRRQFWHKLVAYDSAGTKWKVTSVRLIARVPWWVRALPWIFSARVKVEAKFGKPKPYPFDELRTILCRKLRSGDDLYDGQGDLSLDQILARVKRTKCLGELLTELEAMHIVEPSD